MDRINPTTPHVEPEVTAATRSAAVERSARRGTQAATERNELDRVEISIEGLRMSRASKAVEEAPEVRQDIVGRLKLQVDSGEYTVDSKALASRILDILR